MILLIYLQTHGDRLICYFKFSVHRLKRTAGEVYTASGKAIKMQWRLTGSRQIVKNFPGGLFLKAATFSFPDTDFQ